MYTGLVQATGIVTRADHHEGGLRLAVDPGGWAHGANRGDSISVAGCCLTVTDSESSLQFDVIAESLARTTLGAFTTGTRVNLEACATMATVIGGHLVQGHVDGVGRVVRVSTGADHRVRIQPPPELMEFVTPKGSVAIDGVSLTIAGLDDAWFEVALIPTTLEATTMGALQEGDSCNLEMDIVAKTIVHWAGKYGRSSVQDSG